MVLARMNNSIQCSRYDIARFDNDQTYMVLNKDSDGFIVASRYTLNILIIISYGKRM